MRVLFCGDREWDDEWIVQTLVWGTAVTGHDDPLQVAIHGAARGADSLAEEAACWYDDIDVQRFAADWDTYGKAAGPIRNQRMLDEGKPDVVIAFHDDLAASKGTRDMVERAAKAGLPVYVVSRFNGGRLALESAANAVEDGPQEPPSPPRTGPTTDEEGRTE